MMFDGKARSRQSRGILAKNTDVLQHLNIVGCHCESVFKVCKLESVAHSMAAGTTMATPDHSRTELSEKLLCSMGCDRKSKDKGAEFLNGSPNQGLCPLYCLSSGQ